MARAIDPNKLEFKQPIGLRSAQREWLGKWAPTSTDTKNMTSCLQELLERAMTFWPDGPNAVPKTGGRRASRRAPSNILAIAAKLELSRDDSIRELACRYVREHPDEFK